VHPLRVLLRVLLLLVLLLEQLLVQPLVLLRELELQLHPRLFQLELLGQTLGLF
jgi:hypothetical protein